MMPPTHMQKILSKLVQIMDECEYIQKDKKNTLQNYKYLSEAGIKEKIQPLLRKYKVVFSLSSIKETVTEIQATKSGASQYRTDILTEYSFWDAESGEVFKGTMPASGIDTGDKGVYKAITGAVKYALTVTFLIPTGEDAENDGASATQQAKSITRSDYNPNDEPPFLDEPPAFLAPIEDKPFCPVHQKEKRKNTRGWYCATKLDDGSWCKQ